jgi:hypothetical protein
VERGEKWGYVRRDGTWAIEPTFRCTEAFVGGVAPVQVASGKWGYIEKTGSFVIDPEYAHGSFFYKGIAPVATRIGDEGRFFYINPKGERAFPAEYNYAGDFRYGLAEARKVKEGPFGYIDRTGEFVIAPRFHTAEIFSCQLAAVQDAITKNWLYIDMKGRPVIAIPDARKIETFYKGLAKVRTSTHEGYVNTSGKWVWRRRLDPVPARLPDPRQPGEEVP